MIRIAIVEDEDEFVDQITEYLSRYQKESGHLFQIRRYHDGEEITSGYTRDYDIILMDIQMGLMNGMEAAEQIRALDEYVRIIFITNMAQYALQGYKVGALDYILKPVAYLPFSETLRRALQSIDRLQDQYLTISARDGKYRVRVQNILWVGSMSHRMTFHTDDGDYETSVYTMKEIEERLGSEGFMRCNSGSLINLRRVCGIHKNAITVGNETISVSRGRRAEFMDALVRQMNA